MSNSINSGDREKLLNDEGDKGEMVNTGGGSGSKNKGAFKSLVDKSGVGGPTSFFCRSTTWLFLFLLAGGLCILYLGNSHESGGGLKLGMDKDRAGSYNVKVLPSSLSDKELDALPAESFSYLAMIDAGSSGCRAHIYRYGKLGSLDGPLYVLPQHISKKVKPGLSSFAKNPQGAGQSLKELVEFVQSKVPQSDWGVTPIWLKATAGLRMLEPAESGAVLVSVRNFLGDKTNSPFIFRSSWASIISGNEEGGFGWIAFNYLMKIIGPKKKSGADAQLPYAVIEMGGASSQVSQIAPSEKEAKAIPEDYRFSFTIEGETYTLYTHSYLGYGAEQAREGLNKLLLRNTTLSSSKGGSGGGGGGKDKDKDNSDRGDKKGGGSKGSKSLSEKKKSNSKTSEEGSPQSKRRQLQSNSTSSATATSSSAGTIRDTCLYDGYSRSSSSQPKESYEGPKGKYNVAGASQPSGTCSASLSPLFSPHSSKGKACKKSGGPYSFSCVYQPTFVAESPNFLVFENFFYMSSALGVKPLEGSATAFPLRTTPAEFQVAADKVCSKTWSDVQTSYPVDSQPKDVNTKLCFVASYANMFLTKGLGVRPDKVITVQKDVEASEIEWALGAAYKEAADFLKRTNLRPQ